LEVKQVLNEIKVGPRKLDDGATGEARAGQFSEAIIGQAHGKYYEAASRRRVFCTASQAAVTWSIALTTNYTGLVVSNPRMSNVNLSILRVGFAFSAAQAAESHIGLFGGYDADEECSHDTPQAIYNAYLLGPHGIANADAASNTVSGAPVWIEAYMSIFTAGSLAGTSPVIVDVDGAIIVPPGAYVAIGALTASIGLGSMMWEEVPII